MTDLHTHILPDMDDGSRNIETTNILLQNEIENGVTQIAFTPHYLCFDESVWSFLSRREESYAKIDKSLYENLEFKLGAEVYFCEELLALDDDSLIDLCLFATHYFFLELSMSERQEGVLEFLKRLINMGITPVIVHIERYDYLSVSDIKEFVTLGCKIQCNCESVLRDKRETAFVKSLIKKGLVHVFATDTHSVARRPVNMAAAFAVLKDVETFENNADAIFWNKK